MIRMLIVDDERIDREGVAYLTRKFEFPIETCMAESVEEAMQVLDSQRVDILFTDICMPEQDGLELIRQAKEHQPGLHCVIYSAFGEFDYAKRAMQYGVRHYILKPLKLEEFRATIQAVLEDCRKSGLDRRKEQLLRLLLLGQLPEGEFDIGGHLLLADMSRPLFADSRYDLEAVIGELFGEAVWVSLNEYQAVLVAGGEESELEAAAQAFCRRVERDAGTVTTVVLGSRAAGPEELLAAYTQAETCLDAKFFSKDSQVIRAQGEGGGEAGDYHQRLQDVEVCIRRGEKVRALAEVERLFQELGQSGALSPLYIKYIGGNLIHYCTEVNRNLSQETVTAYVDRLFHCANIYALKDVLVGILDEAMEDGEEDKSTIRQILEIVEQEYMHDISLEQIADRVQLSPSYLSFYFKKETGRNFIKYLTVYRLEKAKELLRNTDIKVIAISEMVGYLNSSYFCLLFKNYTGMTPARYREEAAC